MNKNDKQIILKIINQIECCIEDNDNPYQLLGKIQVQLTNMLK